MHLTQLLNGNFLLWGHTGEPQLWDPVSGFTQVTDATCTNPQICELFCAGHAFLPDGSVLVAGGQNEALGFDNGITQTSIFDGFGWRATGSMRYPRWYPTLVTMFDGRVIALSGEQAPGSFATTPERYGAGVWTRSPRPCGRCSCIRAPSSSPRTAGSSLPGRITRRWS